MEVDDYMNIVFPPPIERTKKVWPCTGDIWCDGGCVLSVRFR